MFEPLLLFVGSIHIRLHVGDVIMLGMIPVLLEQVSRRFFSSKKTKRIEVEEEDKISALPDDLLVRILSLVPTKDAVTTMILSKRWRYIWTMVPKLGYVNHGINKLGLLNFFSGNSYQRSFLRFIDESLRVHKAPVLETLAIELGPRCPVDVNVGKWIEKAVNRKVREIEFILRWSAAEHSSLPNSLYTCDTLVSLSLSEKILVDVPSLACLLPSLEDLELYSVVYKYEDSLVRLLSSCPKLKHLSVERHHQDNVKIFNIKAPLLECLSYVYVELGSSHKNQGIGGAGSMVIESPALKELVIADYSGDSCFIENKPHLDRAFISGFCNPDDDKFMTCLSSVRCLELVLGFTTIPLCNTINLSQLVECTIILVYKLDWLEPLMFLLENSPNLKVLSIDQTLIDKYLPVSWNQPSCVPGCLSTHIEIFEWKEYGGRNEEKELVRYIFANSKCLKRAGISLKPTRTRKKKKMMEELESMSRISTSSHLLFSSQLEYFSVLYETSDY